MRRNNNANVIQLPYSDAVENVPIRKYSNIKVRLYYVVELRLLLISEESVRHPHLGT